MPKLVLDPSYGYLPFIPISPSTSRLRESITVSQSTSLWTDKAIYLARLALKGMIFFLVLGVGSLVRLAAGGVMLSDVTISC